MKSLRIHSFDSRNKTIKSRYSSVKRDTSFNGRPTPLDFDSFIPWFCLELQVPKNVVVRRTNQAEYVPYDAKLSLRSSAKSIKSKSRHQSTKLKLASVGQSHMQDVISSTVPKISLATSTVDITDAIPVTTCYDKRDRLVEIAIIACPFPIPRKVIQAFNLCLPFHTGISKLSIRKSNLCQTILYEISKLLPHSNITEICLDDSCVPSGSYSILLDRPSQIKYLSLKRCSIDDEECKNIATKLVLKGPALKTLLLLDLTSNNITDVGAQSLGEILKYNQYLLYLNLSGNKISDAGASFIFRYLMEFPLSLDDIKEKRQRRMDYLRSRSVTYQKCLQEAKHARFENETKKHVHVSSNDHVDKTINSPKESRRRKIKKHVTSFIEEETTAEEEAERKTQEIVGEFQDPFEEKYITRNGNLIYCTGNFTLTSLNLAYNNLSLLSVRKLLKVLKYQSETYILTSNKGLLRVVIDGNNIPAQSAELNEIDAYFKSAAWKSEQSFNQIL